MKKLVLNLLRLSVLCSILAIPVAAEAYEFESDDIIPIDCFDQGDGETLEQWFMWLPMDTYNKKTYHDQLSTNFAQTFHELIVPFDVGMVSEAETQKIVEEHNLPNGLCKVFYLNEIQQTFNATYNTDIDMASLDGLTIYGNEMVKIINEYFIVIQSPHGIMSNPNPKGGNRLNSNSEYWIWYYQDEWNTTDLIYTIVSYKSVAGYDLCSIDYIGFEPPSDEIISEYKNQSFTQADWETGEYEEIFTVGDYIYYAGPYYLENGEIDGIYGLRMYNTKTREDIAIINRLCRFDVIGDRIFVIGGDVSSGFWSRILVVFNVGSDTGTRVASGIDMDFSMTDTPYSIYNGRIYIGHQTDMEHYEIISFNLEGQDVRVEVPPVETSTPHSYIYEDNAIIDNVIYYYQYATYDKITVLLNNNEIEFDQPPIIHNDRTLVPVRAIFEALGATVAWDGTTNMVTAERNGTTIKIIIGDSYMYKNGESIYLDVPAMIVNERTLVPVRAISEAVGCIVDWDGDNKQVIIRTDNNYYENNASDFANVLAEGEYLELGTHPLSKTPLNWIVLYVEGDEALLLADTTYCALGFGCDYSSVDSYLNLIYKEAFNDTERARIKSTFISDLNSEEKLFVLSADEYEEYAWWTDYINYVLRYKDNNTLYIDNNGISDMHISDWLYVRPACYIDLSNITSYSGDGDIYSAYQIQW